ncbi:MAG: phosphoribosyltransferase family protein [Micromonosporaceae bacterium]|nr:phosphoribosyltransferase family protein [Micromonosporaceae bacterium]
MSAGSRCQTWDGSWVVEHLGIGVVRSTDAGDPIRPVAFEDLAGLAVRDNANRAHLVVSRVLGKHLPVDPRAAVAAGTALGRAVARTVSGQAIVLGYAETATALGHLVADCLDHAHYLHSTRRPVPGVTALGGFSEAHSHARHHLLLPRDPHWFERDDPVVIVDDELTTGRTAIATIQQLQTIHPRDRYVVASLLDLRGSADRAAMQAAADQLGVTVTCIALVTGGLAVPDDVLDRGRRLVEVLERPDPVPLTRPAPVHRLDAPWPSGVPHSGRHGFASRHRRGFARAIERVARLASSRLTVPGPSLVLGTEELMYAPMMLASRLGRRRRHPVRFSSTTRSPVLPVAHDGYAVRTRLSFDAHDPVTPGEPRLRFAYNVAPRPPGNRYGTITVVVDEVGDTPRLWSATGLIECLRTVCDEVSVIVLPAERAEPDSGAGGPRSPRCSRRRSR